jgi:Protein of unknown function (DUF2971)
MKLIFKYFSESNLTHAFMRAGHAGIKCSLPQEYNDPYELFLGIDLDQGPELLANYSEVVQEIPSQLTTCFSKSPVVAPMWAHYADNHRGFVIGLDVAVLQDTFQDLLVREISYRELPSEDLIRFAKMVTYRKKPRDAMLLRDAVRFHAYFSKYMEWSYEQEVRTVNLEDYVVDVGAHKIFYVPKQCIVAVVAGANSTDKTKTALIEAATELGADFYREKIGRSFPTPYLVAGNGAASVFTEEGIAAPEGTCEDCSEPLKSNAKRCAWCLIDNVHRMNAATNNPLRMLDGHGLLERYLEDFPQRPRVPYK